MSVVLQIIVAPLVLDALIGLYHFATDAGWNFRSQVAQFQDHHKTNTMQRWYGWEQMLGVVAGLVLGWLLSSPLFYALGVLTAFSQLPHYFAHHPPKSGPVRWLQRAGVFITPEHHAQHHTGRFDQNFCTFGGWNDIWLNRFTKGK